MVYKPGSVRRNAAGWPFIWDASYLHASSDLPEHRGKLPFAIWQYVPIWSCSRWGLPCQSRYRDRGALLPHRFTLTIIKMAVCFLWHFP